MADYHHPRSTLLGLVSAMYSLGAIVALPFVPSVVDKFGRRHSILIGSLLMIIGGVLQGAALNRKQSITLEPQISSRTLSYDVYRRSLYLGLGDCFRHCSRLFFGWRCVTVPLTSYLLAISYAKNYHIPRNEQSWVHFSTLVIRSVSRGRDQREGMKAILLRLYNRSWSDPRDVCYAQQLGVEDSILPPSIP